MCDMIEEKQARWVSLAESSDCEDTFLSGSDSKKIDKLHEK